MILVDSDTPNSPVKVQQALAEAGDGAGSTSAPPPSYQNAVKPVPAPVPAPEAYAHPSIVEIPRAFVEVGAPESAGRRFFKALGIALLIWLLFGLFTETAIEAGGRRPVKPIQHWPNPDGDHPMFCHGGWVADDASRHLPFDLPVDAETLFVSSTGVLATGDIYIFQSTDPLQTTVKVDVEIRSRGTSRDTLDNIYVCSVEHDHGKKGVTIFTPEQWPEWHPKVQFGITVRFPMSVASPIAISAFETDLSIFTHHVGDLRGNVAFEQLHLKSTHAKITADSLEADILSIQTSDGAIEGTYYASDHLSLVTSNGHIEATVYLYHDTVKTSPTSTELVTSNALLAAPVHLVSTARALTGGLFSVRAKTSNGVLELAVPSIPPDARVQVHAQTSNARAGVTLAPAYEGTFEVHTSNAAPEVQYTHPTDPAGRGRTRNVAFGRARATIRGAVGWDRTGEGVGTVYARTSNGPLMLNLL